MPRKEPSRLTILHTVYDCVPGFYRGGVQKVAYELARAQSDLGHVVEIWTIGPPTVTRVNGVTFRYFSGGAILGGASSRSMRSQLLDSVQRFDVIHGHSTFNPMNRYVSEASVRAGVPCFYHTHGAIDPVLLRWPILKALKKRSYFALFERPSLNRAAALFALTASEREQLLTMGLTPHVEVVGNGVDPAPIMDSSAAAEFRRAHGVPPSAPCFIFLGRITPKKNIELLLRAFALIRQRLPDARLAICGDRMRESSYVGRLDRLAQRLRLDGCVVWPGFLSDDQKSPAFFSADVFLHASLSEGMAMAVLEAMAHGVPTVVTPGCYMDEASRVGAVHLADASATSIARTAIAAYFDKDRETPARYALAHHSWKAVASAILVAYRSNCPGVARRPG